jgi:PAS domain-containing protein
MAIIPALGITIYSGLEQRNQARLHALEDAQRLAQEISKDHDHLIQNARQTLFTLSKISQVQEQDKDTCCKISADIMKQSEDYTALAAAKPNGDVFASSMPITRPINYSDRPWFQRLLKTRDFVIGEYQIGRVSGKPSIVLAYPVLDDIGNLKAILALGMDLDWLKQTIAKIKLPEGISVSVIDSDGTILFHFPDPGKFIGKSMPEASIVKKILAERKGAEEALRNSEEKFRTLFEESKDAILITTREGNFIDFNKSTLDLFGYNKEEMMGLNMQNLYVHSGERSKFQPEIESTHKMLCFFAIPFLKIDPQGKTKIYLD